MSAELTTIPAVNDAMAHLRRCGIGYKLPTPYQIKVGAYNFYPTTGRITLDGTPNPLNERGLDAFVNIVEKLRSRREIFSATPPASMDPKLGEREEEDRRRSDNFRERLKSDAHSWRR